MIADEVHHVPAHGRDDGARSGSVYRSFTRRRREESTRLSLLHVHAFIGLFAGVLILFAGTGEAFTDDATWARPLTGTLALAGGAVLLTAMLRRHVLLQMLGALLLAGWTLAMTGGLAVAVLGSSAVTIDYPWVSVDGAATPALYPLALYGGLLAMLLVHLLALRQEQVAEVRARVRVRRPS